MHTHHSHSGQFCQHAKNSLEEMVLRAIDMRFELICMSEHMPRFHDRHLYPEELESHTSVEDLRQTFDAYIKEAHRLRQKYGDQIEILIGFESEGIDDEYLAKTEQLADHYKVDFVVGSLHHSDDTPIDYDLTVWNKQLLSRIQLPDLIYKYFDRLQVILNRLKPAVIAHYDLIRLFAPDAAVTQTAAWPLITATIDTAIANDCMFELNSSAIRKGWQTPYPQRDIASYIVTQGGKFCLSDDSHNVDQVGLNYHKVVSYLNTLGVSKIWRLKMSPTGVVEKISVEVSIVEAWINANKYPVD